MTCVLPNFINKLSKIMDLFKDYAKISDKLEISEKAILLHLIIQC